MKSKNFSMDLKHLTAVVIVYLETYITGRIA